MLPEPAVWLASASKPTAYVAIGGTVAKKRTFANRRIKLSMLLNECLKTDSRVAVPIGVGKERLRTDGQV